MWPVKVSRTYRTMDSVRACVRRRAGGRCEICSKPFTRNPSGGAGHPRSDATFHHRHKREYGGLDDVSNLLHVHLTCHQKIHENEALAESLGLILRYATYAWTPVSLRPEEGPRRWFLLAPDATREEVPENDATLTLQVLNQAKPKPKRRKEKYVRRAA